MWSFCFNSLQNFARVCCFCFLEKEILTTLDLRKRKGEQNLALSSHHFKFPLKTKVPVMSIQSGLWEQDDWRREVMSCESICSVKAGKSLPSHLSFFTVLFALSASPLPGLLVVALTHWKQKGSWALAIPSFRLLSLCIFSVSLCSLLPSLPRIEPQVTLPRRAGQPLPSSPLCLGELNTVDVFHSGFVSLRGLYGLIPERSNVVTLLWQSEISAK